MIFRFGKLFRYPPEGSIRARWKIHLCIATVGAALFLPAIGSAWPPGCEFHEKLEYLGLWLMIVSMFGKSWCAMYLVGSRSNELIRSGPYSVCRNPWYHFTSIGVIGLGMQAGNLTIPAIFFAGAFASYYPVIRYEEMALSQKFGKAYERYKRAVPRFGIRPSLWRDAPFLAVHLASIYLVFRDSVALISLAPLFEGSEILQAHHLLPVYLCLP